MTDAAAPSLGVLYLLETGGPGGAERMLVELAGSLGAGWHPVVGVAKPGWLRSQATAAGIACVMLKAGGLGDVGVLACLRQAIKAHRIAVIHAHEFYMSVVGTVVSLATGVPLVVTIHGKSYYPDRGRRRAACRMVVAGAGAVVTVSEDLRRFFCRTVGARIDQVRVIHNGIVLPGPAEAPRKDVLLAAAGIPRDAQIVGAVGNLYPVKGHLDLVRAARTIVQHRPKAHVIILGRGALHDTLLAEAESLGIRDRLHLLGFRDDVKEWLEVFDVFTLPSQSEGLPLSLLEAMAAGVPVVVTGVGGMPEVVEDRTHGFVVAPGDVRALAARVITLLEDPAMAARLGTAGAQRIADRFTLNSMVAKYRGVYRQVIEAGAARGGVVAGLRRHAGTRLARLRLRRRMRRAARHPGELVTRVQRARTITFVCLGNIIRSAFAAELLRARTRRRDLLIHSAGLRATPDDPAHPSAVQCAERFGVDLSVHRTHRLDRLDVEEADILFAMEIDHVIEIHRLFPQHWHKVYLFGCVLDEESLDIADPVFAPREAFEVCFDRIDRGVRRLVEMLPASV